MKRFTLLLLLFIISNLNSFLISSSAVTSNLENKAIPANFNFVSLKVVGGGGVGGRVGGSSNTGGRGGGGGGHGGGRGSTPINRSNKAGGGSGGGGSTTGGSNGWGNGGFGHGDGTGTGSRGSFGGADRIYSSLNGAFVMLAATLTLFILTL